MLSKINILIFDEKPGSRDYLEQLARKNLPLVDEIFSTGKKELAKHILSNENISILFLDLEISGNAGFDFLNSLKERNFEIIFIAEDSKYALQAIRYSAIDYLLKPVVPEELAIAFNRFLVEPNETAKRLKAYERHSEHLNSNGENNYKLSLKKGNSIYFVAPKNIYWCKADGNYTKIYLEDETEFILSKTLKEFENMLGSPKFVRVHKSNLVNMNHALKIVKNELILKNNVKIEISRRRKDDLTNFLSGRI